jgi:hypothetical protein
MKAETGLLEIVKVRTEGILAILYSVSVRPVG